MLLGVATLSFSITQIMGSPLFIADLFVLCCFCWEILFFASSRHGDLVYWSDEGCVLDNIPILSCVIFD